MKRTTIIDFVEKYTREFSELTFLREKVDGVWTETSFRETREEAYRIGAGLYQLGLKKGDKVITAGGIYGHIKEVQETTFLLEVAKDVVIKVDKGSVYVAAEDAQQASQNAK